MEALLAVSVMLTALPPPPTDDGAACQEWAVAAAEELLGFPAPTVTGLGGVTAGGLSEIQDEVWAQLGGLGYPKEDGARWHLVKEGLAPVSSAPRIAAALSSSEAPLRRVLRAALGPANGLPDSWQVWCTFGCPGQPSSESSRYDVPMLALALGWRGLERDQSQDAVLSCLGLAGYLRALGATGLIGQMLATSYARGLSLECLTAARAASASRREILSALERVSQEWSPFSRTLTQELVFGQVLNLQSWPPALRARLPRRWLPVASGRSVVEKDSTWAGVRAFVFGRWAVRDHCLRLARVVQSADGPPSTADPIFLSAGSPGLVGRLAWDDGGTSSWIRFARRFRRLQTELRMLLVGLRSTAGDPARPEVDARTGRALELRGWGPDRVVVAVADPEFDAEELRLPAPEGRPTSP